jgi:hypothetical protein
MAKIDSRKEPRAETDNFYWENGFVVFKESFLIRKGSCCGSGCRHCPYEPKHDVGAVHLRKGIKKSLD